MSLIANLSDYSKAEGFALITQAITRGKTAEYANIVSGLKGTGLVPFMSSEINLTAGGSCSFNNNGTTTFSEVEIAVKPVDYTEAICIGALEGKAMMYEVGGYGELPYAAQFLQEKADQISNQLDNLYWNGSVLAGDPFNGFLAQATAASLLNTVATATTGVMDAVDAAIDAAVAFDSTFQTSNTVAVFMSFADFRALQKELVAANYFHYAAEAIGDNLSLTFPGTNVKVIATPGITAGDLYLADYAHLHIGTNLASEAEAIKVYHDQITNNLYLRSQFYAGCGVSKTIFAKAI